MPGEGQMSYTFSITDPVRLMIAGIELLSRPMTCVIDELVHKRKTTTTMGEGG